MKKQTKWIEVIPYGIVGGMVPGASAMLFKKKKGVDRFSIWLTELQSRIAVDQSLNKEQPFSFVQKILKEEGYTPKSCFFVESKNDRDKALLTFHGKKKSLEFFADEIISFCILNGCRFFCTKDFLEGSRHEIPRRFKGDILEKRPHYLN
ncbi:MAG: hypothetical protein OXB86_02240 [Bdellovibrionales bacterium]|nr:hypothetical protein [Bdellovibrionales bacterium]